MFWIRIWREQFHINSQHTQQVKFQCAICDHFTYQKSRLASHIKNVHNNSDLDKQFQCEQCPFKANIKRKLQDHTMRNHTTKKPYKCDLCDYRAKVSKDVQTHKRKHHNKDTIKLKCSEWLMNLCGMAILQDISKEHMKI